MTRCGNLPLSASLLVHAPYTQAGVPPYHLNRLTDRSVLHATRSASALHRVTYPDAQISKKKNPSVCWNINRPRWSGSSVQSTGITSAPTSPRSAYTVPFGFRGVTTTLSMRSRFQLPESGIKSTAEDTHWTRYSSEQLSPGQIPWTHLSVINPSSGLQGISAACPTNYVVVTL